MRHFLVVASRLDYCCGRALHCSCNRVACSCYYGPLWVLLLLVVLLSLYYGPLLQTKMNHAGSWVNVSGLWKVFASCKWGSWITGGSWTWGSSVGGGLKATCAVSMVRLGAHNFHLQEVDAAECLRLSSVHGMVDGCLACIRSVVSPC